MNSWLSVDHSLLRERTGEGIRIAVIDSGVASSHPHVGAVGRGTSLVGDDPDDIADRIGHGTAVFSAIRDAVPQAELVPIRVLDRQLATSARLLAQAIDWAVEAGAFVVNLSFGTTNDAHIPLFELSLAAANAASVVVVAPHSQDGRHWYPGSLHGAVGVVADQDIPRLAVAPLGPPLGSALAASPYPRPIHGVPVERNLSGVSFAVANATGVIARALAAGAPATPPEALLAWIAERTLPPPPNPR